MPGEHDHKINSRAIMKKITSIACIALAIFAICTFFIEHSRSAPENLTVFVINNPREIPAEFYSSPHANQLTQQGYPLARMTLSRARRMGIKMAEDSKQDFSCFHSPAVWWLIDHEMWPNSCRWNSRGEWQNSQWPRWIEVPLRMFGFFKD